MTQSNESLRLGFNAVPEIYDRIRPLYPSALYDELFALLPPEPNIVEVGPGTGQATDDLLKRGAVVTAIEIGHDLASFLVRKLGAYDRLKVIRSSFEDAPLFFSTYDAVVSATAYHWVQPPARLEKPAAILKPHGRLAVIDTNQVASPLDRGYFERVQPIYEKHGQGGGHRQLTTADDVVPPIYDELVASSHYNDVRLFRYPYDQHYTSGEYADLLRSYSGSQAMLEEQRETLIHELCAVIDQEYGGNITRPLVITLTVAQTMVPDPPPRPTLASQPLELRDNNV
jgi:SAM-dependent methyltransferase